MLQMYHFTSFSLNFKSNVLVKRALFLLNAAFAIVILDLICKYNNISKKVTFGYHRDNLVLTMY